MEQLQKPGEIIAQRYRILDQLGRGGSGITYQVEDLQSHQQVALKALSLHHLTDWKMMELFEREAHVLAQLNHPSIPRYLDYFSVDTPRERSFYIAQQLAAGQSLAEGVKNGWHTTESKVRNIAIQVLETLVYLHQLKPPVIHRDIKPQNIIMSDDGRVFLVDFGAVQDTYHSTFIRGSTVVGTFGYMAPEQFRGQAVPTSDLYGLGATLLFLLTHRSPAELPTDGLGINFRSHVQISPEFADWLEQMLEPDVVDRFSSAQEALAVLQGKQIVKAKTPPLIPWKGLVAVAIATVATFSIVNYFKLPILISLGLTPSELCRDSDNIRNYLDQGGNPNAREHDIRHAQSLLSCAFNSNNQELAIMLITKGADINLKNDSLGETSLHRAVLYDWKDVVELLIAKGANVNAKDKYGSTPLYRVQSKQVAQLLIAQGADVKVKNNYDETPLHRVAYRGKPDLIELLITQGADVNAKNKDGETPLKITAKDDNQVLVKLLKAHGAK